VNAAFPREPGAFDREQPERPLLRGMLHGAMAVAAPFLFVVLLLAADSARDYVAVTIFAAAMMLVYTASASYHLAPWPPRLRRIMTRVDHAMIFVLIAGSYTPFCLTVVGDAWGIPMLSIVWTLAVLGVLMKLLWVGVPRWLSVSCYIGLGWLAVVAAPAITASLSAQGVALLAGGGVLYTIGGIVYGLRRPDPLPRIFGFHEVFHVLVIAGTALHVTAVALYVL
jgi:hemolysin III